MEKTKADLILDIVKYLADGTEAGDLSGDLDLDSEKDPDSDVIDGLDYGSKDDEDRYKKTSSEPPTVETPSSGSFF